MRRGGRRLFGLGIGLLAGLSVGCGLADYEDKVRQEQARVENLDKEFKALGPPLTVPPLKEGEPNYVEVFLRPPRGVQDKHYVTKDGPYRIGPAYWYARSDGSKAPVLGVALATAAKEGEPVQEKELIAALGGQLTEEGEQEVRRPGGRNLKLRKVRLVGSRNEQFLVYTDPDKQVAIVFQTDPQIPNDLIRQSLETLEIGPSAVKARADYGLRAKGERTK